MTVRYMKFLVLAVFVPVFLGCASNPPPEPTLKPVDTDTVEISGVVKSDNDEMLTGAKVIAEPLIDERIKYPVTPEKVQAETNEGYYSLKVSKYFIYRLRVVYEKYHEYCEEKYQQYTENVKKDSIMLTNVVLSNLILEIQNNDGTSINDEPTINFYKKDKTFELRSDGKYHLDGISPGKYKIDIYYDNREGSETFELKDEPEREIKVTVDKKTSGTGATDSDIHIDVNQGKVQSSPNN